MLGLLLLASRLGSCACKALYTGSIPVSASQFFQRPLPEAEISPITGLPVRHVGRVLTSEDVAMAEHADIASLARDPRVALLA